MRCTPIAPLFGPLTQGVPGDVAFRQRDVDIAEPAGGPADFLDQRRKVLVGFGGRVVMLVPRVGGEGGRDKQARDHCIKRFHVRLHWVSDA